MARRSARGSNWGPKTPQGKPWGNHGRTLNKPRARAARKVGKLAFDFSEGLVVGLGLPPGPERETLRLKWAEFSDNVFTYTVRTPSRRARGTGARTGSPHARRSWTPGASSARRAMCGSGGPRAAARMCPSPRAARRAASTRPAHALVA